MGGANKPLVFEEVLLHELRQVLTRRDGSGETDGRAGEAGGEPPPGDLERIKAVAIRRLRAKCGPDEAAAEIPQHELEQAMAAERAVRERQRELDKAEADSIAADVEAEAALMDREGHHRDPGSRLRPRGRADDEAPHPLSARLAGWPVKWS